jgi:MoxR-like ATPase
MAMNFNPEVHSIEAYQPEEDVYWKDIADERQIVRQALEMGLPLAFKGPTGTGKTQLAKRMRYEFAQDFVKQKYIPEFRLDHESGLYMANTEKKKVPVSFPLYIVDGTEGTEEFHLLGAENAAGKWIGGPIYHWAHTGGICLVNELAEIRNDVQTIFHSMLDDDRTVSFPDIAQIVKLPDHALFIAGYNPGYQSKKDPLKISTKHRLPCVEFTYPPMDVETEIIYNASKHGGKEVKMATAEKLAQFAAKVRSEDREESILGSREGVSTRLLVRAARWIAYSGKMEQATQVNISRVLGSDAKESEALEEILRSFEL